jgi:hypothetical protein
MDDIKKIDVLLPRKMNNSRFFDGENQQGSNVQLESLE